MGVSVPFSCNRRIMSSVFCALRFGPMRLRIRVQLSSAQSSNSRRLDASMSSSVKVAEPKSPMDIGGSRSILFCTKQSSSSMMTPLLLSLMLAPESAILVLQSKCLSLL